MNDNATVPMTREGKLRLEQELERLIKVERREIAAQLKEAISHGDLRENAGYEEAKRAQALLEIRIREISDNLAQAVLIDENAHHGDAVALGTRVVIRETGTDYEEEYQIVGKTETDPAAGRISNESPMGQALLGKRVGEQAVIETPAASITFDIVRFEGL